MSKGLIAVIVVILIFGFVGCGKYNGLVSKDEVVKESWAKVESQYQRRADLIPNLVSTVKGAADFEKGTLTAVIEARSKATQTTINAGDLTPENIAKFQGAQDQLSGALSRLLVTVEQYPQLKANQNFLDLQAQLEGTENRITVARNDFNTVVKDYNQEVRTFPNNLFAGIFGFSQKGYFTAAAGSDKAPTVQF
ncbi:MULTISPECIES: LemA family protein [Dyadobacter]|jgi:LemA protein|uniref:LemA family protein n=1 Tax=Dyadobacter chenhuakuii TaxID=2909339 RepID=A0A9X1TTK0_9BACT|nr:MULTISPECIES: LemA family protein [Dyadobacter]MCE7069237.1 LemA family protein [Dyadobacter sp. CY327]MCF2495233.1 LemA family protein [Dyadobacter chenhuakuii]MCF2500274.1 LemA family protein [Dyadobacter chenhuakuii]MCF2516184.1 LemA family protein [Dyadobacter sp. CY351]USJ29275.1 LemA family protein [Dyadobacter chenhuakuii]